MSKTPRNFSKERQATERKVSCKKLCRQRGLVVKCVMINGECDRHSHSSKPTRANLLNPWERYFTGLFSAWPSWRAVLNFGHIFKYKQKINKKISTEQQYLGISKSRSR